ncbi:SGNH/GDSL hydrolase family protein [Brevibacillus daliensis]|uniref:SGNH/GDSL hydrolase family protein n=1 Tax=Brevibacillus daliensis TaxID=2892995 RepID=UPI001E55638B|nr:SGNH/GDSL hydrolase family protein [Brevibacillus daliensis]
MKEKFRPKLNVIIIILVLISFVLIDLLVVPQFVAKRIEADASFRLPVNFGFGELKAFVDVVNKDDDPKIILVGDSVIKGGGVDNGTESLAHYLEDEVDEVAPDYQVYNLGLSGGAPGDAFFIVKALDLEPEDIVIFDLNTGHYGNTVVKFMDKTGHLAFKEINGASLYDDLQITEDRIEDRLQTLMVNVWDLYAYRDMIKELMFPDPDKPMPQPINYNVWSATDWTEKVKGTSKRGAYLISDKDLSVDFTRYMIQDVKEQGSNILIFNTPLNQEMMQKYNMIDRFNYDRNIDFLEQVVEKEGGEFVDYEKIVPADDFTDSIHPMAKGNRIIANHLVDDMESWLLKEKRDIP